MREDEARCVKGVSLETAAGPRPREVQKKGDKRQPLGTQEERSQGKNADTASGTKAIRAHNCVE